jgi:hypothetical protein
VAEIIRLDLGERGAVILVGANGPYVHVMLHQNCDTVSASMYAWMPRGFNDLRLVSRSL